MGRLFNIKVVSYCVLGVLCLFYPSHGRAQSFDKDKEQGSHLVRYYSPREYNNFPQVWAVAQETSGAMVFGGSDGILRFDGVRWSFLPLRNMGVVRSLALGANGKVFIGAYNEVGYVGQDSLGSSVFVSLVERLPPESRRFGNTHRTYAYDDAILFQTETSILIWRDDKFVVIPWSRDPEYRMSFISDSSYYVFEQSVGLGVFKDSAIVLLPGGDFFKNKAVREIISFDDEFKLIVTTRDGFFLYSENRIIPFKTQIDDFLMKSLVYCAKVLPDNSICLGTLMGGAFIIDRQGNVKSVLNKKTGLGDNSIYNIGLDASGALWITTAKGINRVEIDKPITHFLESSISGSVNAITRHKGELYAATTDGLYRLKPLSLPDSPASFERLSALNTGIWGMTNLGQSIILNTDQGTFIFENGTFTKLNTYTQNSVVQGKTNPDIMFCALTDGVSILKRVNEKWEDWGRIPGVRAEVWECRERANGDIWLLTYSDGFLLLKYPIINGRKEYFTDPRIVQFGEDVGVTIGFTTSHLIGNEELFFVRRNGLPNQVYRFDESSEKLIPHNTFAQSIGLDTLSAYPITDEVDGRFWVQISDSNERLIVTRHQNNSFSYRPVSFERLKGYKFRVVFEEGDIAWWGGHDGLIRMDLSRSQSTSTTPHQLGFNRISFSNDSILYKGGGQPLQNLEFPFENNSLRFDYAAAAYDNHSDNAYQYQLEGFDRSWSGWTKETYKNYTGLPEGRYIFRVKSRDIYGGESAPAAYAFSISPPWFRSWWAYLVYATLAFALVGGLVQIRLRSIRKEKKTLERIVQERTREVREQAHLLEDQAVRLKELDKAKSRFFTNISHEFRTPLSLIMGLLEDSNQDNASTKDAYRIAVMQRNTQRLQTLINQLLDLSRLEARVLTLAISPGNIGRYLRAFAAGFTSLASQRNIALDVDITGDDEISFFDVDKLEKMVSNLLSNALKFTPAGGTVTFVATRDGNLCCITVSDTGPGIPPEFVSKVFERFYRIDNPAIATKEGAGIGLALTRELAELHRGTVVVVNTGGEGCTFQLTIPVNKGAFTEEELSRGKPGNGSVLRREPALRADHAEKTDVPEDRPIVLVAEDNADLRQFIADHLREYKVEHACDGREALKLAHRLIPDLVISDIMMPEIDGVELCQKLKADEKTSHIPVFLLTARADIQSRLDGLQTGADDYITKPFHASELQIRVRNMIVSRRELRNRFSRSVILKPTDVAITSTDEIFLQRIMTIVEAHMSDSAFSTQDFQKEIAMSRMQLHRKIKALTGHATGEFVRIQRLIRAKDLLLNRAGNVTDVCYQTGFSDVSYFAKCFKKQFGFTPTEFLARHSEM